MYSLQILLNNAFIFLTSFLVIQVGCPSQTFFENVLCHGKTLNHSKYNGKPTKINPAENCTLYLVDFCLFASY